MTKSRDFRKVVAITTLSIGVLLAVPALVSWIHISHRLRGDFAYQLGRDSFDSEKEHLKERAQELGSSPSAGSIADQWNVLLSQTQNQGMTPEAASKIIARTSSWENSMFGATESLDQQLWPLTAVAAYRKNREVWIIHMAYWDSKIYKNSSTSNEIRCGTDAEFRRMSYRTYVVDGQVPYRCWVTSFAFERMSPQQQKECIVDE